MRSQIHPALKVMAKEQSRGIGWFPLQMFWLIEASSPFARLCGRCGRSAVGNRNGQCGHGNALNPLAVISAGEGGSKPANPRSVCTISARLSGFDLRFAAGHIACFTSFGAGYGSINKQHFGKPLHHEARQRLRRWNRRSSSKRIRTPHHHFADRRRVALYQVVTRSRARHQLAISHSQTEHNDHETTSSANITPSPERTHSDVRPPGNQVGEHQNHADDIRGRAFSLRRIEGGWAIPALRPCSSASRSQTRVIQLRRRRQRSEPARRAHANLPAPSSRAR